MTGIQLMSALPTICGLLQPDAGGGASPKAPTRGGFFICRHVDFSRRKHHSVRQYDSISSTKSRQSARPLKGFRCRLPTVRPHW